MDLIPSLLQQMCVYLVFAYLLSKTPIFMPLLNISSRWEHKLSCYVLFSIFCIMGSYFGLQYEGAIANTRAIGAVMGGLFGGPVVGLAVGMTGGIHRYFMGGFTDVACAISTSVEGLIGGLLHIYLLRNNKINYLFKPQVVFLVTLVAELTQMAIVLVVAEPYEQAYSLVREVALPMITANTIGAVLFMSIIEDRKSIYEKYSTVFSQRALRIADRSVGILNQGLNAESAHTIATIIHQETNVAAIAITDTNHVLAFVGVGEQHHRTNVPISSHIQQSIDENRIIDLNNTTNVYQCAIDRKCSLGTAIILPLRNGDNKVVGTIKLYEPRRKLLSNINISMAKGIAQLLSSHILLGHYQQQQTLLTQAELKLLHAQVNPHFLFNALTTISAVTRREPEKARILIQHLSQFFRKNLKQNIESVSLREELSHVNAYLTIEQARLTNRLSVRVDISPALMDIKLPSFTLQPLIENAIKHGISTMLSAGKLEIYSHNTPEGIRIFVTDNAGTFVTSEEENTGLGLKIVDKRLINHFNERSSLQISVTKNKLTQVSFLLPTNTITTNKEY
ncbi:sensor histidine kinase [Moritella sp. Urea-trap-13]|uniref:sensor histidine kinase n=1 Tax=Moritella sp. Urea-trap-13 TaxID=2058327 RepID=UPI000C32D7AF|nr:sensor histidine kinase [Moritella sp. Urea-trap-13]PKH07056.1 sensor histidine kinase [Moritella sp. Urea-trap-13]